jgi:hypothetical protein
LLGGQERCAENGGDEKKQAQHAAMESQIRAEASFPRERGRPAFAFLMLRAGRPRFQLSM